MDALLDFPPSPLRDVGMDTTPVVDQQQQHADVKKRRKAHAKVKTGCMTCKIRRKKCDEAKPFCNRCVESGRKCDGYANSAPKLFSDATAYPMQQHPTPRHQQNQWQQKGQYQHSTFQQQPSPPADDKDPAKEEDSLQWQHCARHPQFTSHPTTAHALLSLLRQVQNSQVCQCPSKTAISHLLICSPVCGGTAGLTCPCTPNTVPEHTTSCLARCPLYSTVPKTLMLAQHAGLSGNELDQASFDFFRLKTGPAFAGYFDSSGWSKMVLEAAFLEPVVLRAVVAVGAVHRRWELGLTPEAFRMCEVAEKAYWRMKVDWKRGLEEPGRNESLKRPEIQMVLAKLCATFESFQDEEMKAKEWMARAFAYLFQAKVRMVVREERSVEVRLDEKTLRQYFMKLEWQASYLWGRSVDVGWSELEDKLGDDWEMPRVFQSMEDARDALFAEVRLIWKANCQELPIEKVKVVQRKHLARLMQWTAAYGEYSKTHRPNNDDFLKRLGRLLKWYREAAFLQLLLHCGHRASCDNRMMVSTGLESDQTFLSNSSHCSYCHCDVSIQAQFARLHLLSDGLINESVPFGCTALVLEGHTGMGMHTGSSSCRSSKIRSRLRKLMAPSNQKLGMYTIAERMSELEENATDEIRRYIEDATGTEWVDVSYFLDAKMICLIYCKNDKTRSKGLVWVREWYKLDET